MTGGEGRSGAQASDGKLVPVVDRLARQGGSGLEWLEGFEKPEQVSAWPESSVFVVVPVASFYVRSCLHA